MVLGAEPDEVAGDAAEVFDAVHAANGIVLSSSVNRRRRGRRRRPLRAADPGRQARRRPRRLLRDRRRPLPPRGDRRHHRADGPQLGEHLRDSQAKIDSLLAQLAGADSEEERAEVEAELRAERRHAAALRSQATKLNRRANLSRVSLRIETGAGATSPGGGGGWGVGDALHDAGHILAIAAGVTIVGLAILAPLALIALLAWLANRACIRRARERALG